MKDIGQLLDERDMEILTYSRRLVQTSYLLIALCGFHKILRGKVWDWHFLNLYKNYYYTNGPHSSSIINLNEYGISPWCILRRFASKFF